MHTFNLTLLKKHPGSFLLRMMVYVSALLTAGVVVFLIGYISTRIISWSEPNITSASALDSSVLPTPVGPRKRKEPIGLLGS